MHDDLGPQRRQVQGHGAADPRGGTRDQGRGSGQLTPHAEHSSPCAGYRSLPRAPDAYRTRPRRAGRLAASGPNGHGRTIPWRTGREMWRTGRGVPWRTPRRAASSSDPALPHQAAVRAVVVAAVGEEHVRPTSGAADLTANYAVR
ncbi:hypothetical protein Shyhy02_08330 [Streptomyces hygroscopicus subsp. hygroscopicus]|nr:hypothetical protein Shyhy02_08330 [Streptomyces hygroscopicus subsp. hygroscopicus]